MWNLNINQLQIAKNLVSERSKTGSLHGQGQSDEAGLSKRNIRGMSMTKPLADLTPTSFFTLLTTATITIRAESEYNSLASSIDQARTGRKQPSSL